MQIKAIEMTTNSSSFHTRALTLRSMTNIPLIHDYVDKLDRDFYVHCEYLGSPPNLAFEKCGPDSMGVEWVTVSKSNLDSILLFHFLINCIYKSEFVLP